MVKNWREKDEPQLTLKRKKKSLFTIAEVIEEEADELGGGGCMSDGKFDDELTFDGSVGDELQFQSETKTNYIFANKKQVFIIDYNLPLSNRWHRIQ